MPAVNPNFMISDVFGASAAFFLFPLFLLIPGYVCGWLLDAFGFRQRGLLARLAASVTLSIGISPVLAYLLWHRSILAIWVAFGAMWAGFLGLFIYERRIWLSRPVFSRRQAAFLAIVAGWIILGTFLLIDLQFKLRLYFPVVAHDYTLRAAITASITRSGIPPHNPYFFPGRSFVLRYHYFWFILCSLVSQMGRSVSPRQAMLAGTVWSGVGLTTLIPLYLRFFQPKGPNNLDKRMLIGVALLSVTGLDILPVAFLDIFSRHILPSIEWWNYAVGAWVGAVLWAPHHVAALIACLTGFLLIWYRRNLRGAKGDFLASVGAGIMFASALGLSVYVTFVFAVFLAVWVAVTSIKRQFRETVLISVAGMVALAVSLPYIFELLGGHSNQSASGGPFVQFAIRPFAISEILLSKSQSAKPWLIPVVNALVLPLNYFLELGFFLLIGFVQWKKMRASRNFFGHRELCGFMMVATSMLLCTFFRSGVIMNNDLGMRGFMVAQFMLLIWGAELLDEGLLKRAVNTGGRQRDPVRLSRDGKNLVIVTLVLGAAGTLYDICVLRSFPIIADSTGLATYAWLSSNDGKFGKRTYALRQVYEELKKKLPQDAIIQHNPHADPGDLPHGLYADRQLAAETFSCGAVFGGDLALCKQIIGPIDDLFEKPDAVDMGRLDAICKSLSMDALIVKDTDPVWADKNSWVWKNQPIVSNAYARAFLCGCDPNRVRTHQNELSAHH
jgi:hypothetical protein